MISIVGNIKIDESKPERIEYLLASIRSYAFLKNYCQFILCLQSPSRYLMTGALQAFINCDFKDFHLLDATISPECTPLSYGKQYCTLLDQAKHDFVLNFMEDQFMVMNAPNKMVSLLAKMEYDGVEVCKTSFNQIERNSARTLRRIMTDPISEPIGISFVNNETNFREYQRHYGKRFYIGVNFLTTKKFAYKFWNRDLGPRPHEYEISTYSPAWLHTCLIPGEQFELQAAIDDDHGEPGTCLLKREPAKFRELYQPALSIE